MSEHYEAQHPHQERSQAHELLAARAADRYPVNPMGEYPRKDIYHNIAYWTGPVGNPGSHVTGWKYRDGARTTYYQVTCTCEPYRGIGAEITGHGWMEVRDELESLAYEHAVTHVLAADHGYDGDNRHLANNFPTD